MKISEIIVVEGRDDTQAVKCAAECETIETHGFGMPEEIWKSLDRAYKSRGLIIFTDPNHAGDLIRKKIKERYPESREAFLPRCKALKAHDVGVENAKPEDIREALGKARAGCSGTDSEKSGGAPVTMEMFMDNGLTGVRESRIRRERLADVLGIACGNAKSMLSHINAFGITAGEFNEAVRSIDNKTDKE